MDSSSAPSGHELEDGMQPDLEAAAAQLRGAVHVTAFTGAGISVESGIPSFRGEEGLWSKYDPNCLDIDYFHRHTAEAWRVIREIFYDFFGQARPNFAHHALAALEHEHIVQAVITQNIDNLHYEAGSVVVHEFHGTSRLLRCLNCDRTASVSGIDLSVLPPLCRCGGVYKPDFVFFGENIPEPAGTNSFREAELADVFLLIGTTGEVYPASLIPREARQNGAFIIEINPEPSEYTHTITDIFLNGKAGSVMRRLMDILQLPFSDADLSAH